MILRKVVFAAAAAVMCVSFSANAGVHPNAIGLRISNGAEINYQMGLGAGNRLELGLGGGFGGHDGYWENPNYWHRGSSYSSIGIFGAYQWHWNISPSAARGGFNWYIGPGGGFGVWSRDWIDASGRHHDDGSGFSIGGGGQIGIEYDFNVLGAPVLLDIDYRPSIIGISDGGFYIGGPGVNFGLGIRYTF